MKVQRIRRLASVAMLAGLGGLVGGCQDAAGPTRPIFWEGTFSPDPSAWLIVTGRAEMVANPGDTSAGVFLEAPVDGETVMYWHVRNGPCSGSGERVAPADAFPSVTIDLTGEGMAFSSVRRRLPAGTYAAEIFAEPEGGVRLACAELN